MTRVIALDVSAWWGGVALVEHAGSSGPAIVAEIGLRVPGWHAVHLIRAIDMLLAEASWSRTSVDAYAATRGPGSFTGLRIGLGTVLGLTLATGRPGIGVGTLEATADAFGPSEGERVPLLDAGRGDVFGARYDPEGFPPEERTAPWIGPPEQALDGPSLPRVLFGSGADAYRDRLVAAGTRLRVARAPSSIAGGAGRIAAVRLRQTGCTASADLVPLYLRPADAELNRTRSEP